MKKLTSLLYKNMIKSLSRIVQDKEFPCPEPIKVDDSADLNFIALGDPQISFISPLRSARVYSACKDIKKADGVFDLLVMLGDITEYGMTCEYMTMAHLLSPIERKIKNVIAISGNHDIRLRSYKKQLKKFNAFLMSMPNGIAGRSEHYYFTKEINGYKFIMMGADKPVFESTYISREQLNWLDSELNKADRNKPVFILNHQPIKNTHGLPSTWLGKGDWRGHMGKQSDDLRRILEKYNNSVYITGHLHLGTSKYNFEDYGTFRAISAQTAGVLNHGNYSHHAQGYVISVTGNKISARARVFSQGRWVEDETENSSFEFAI